MENSQVVTTLIFFYHIMGKYMFYIYELYMKGDTFV